MVPYCDDFLIIPTSFGTFSQPSDSLRVLSEVKELMKSLGLCWNDNEGKWNGAQVVDHVRVLVDPFQMTFMVVA